MRRSTKVVILGIALLSMALMPYIGDAWRAAADAKARQAVAEALRKVEAEKPAMQALASIKSAQPVEVGEEPEEAPLSIRQQKCLAHAIDGEAGAEPFEGKKGVAFVAVGRARDNRPYWGGADLCKVVCKHDVDRKGITRWQFDGAAPACKRNMAGKPSDEAMDIAGKVLIGEYVPTEEESRWRYFFNQYESGFNGATSLLCETKIGRTINRHIFAEPKEASKTCLWRKKHLPQKPAMVVASHKLATHKNRKVAAK